MVIVNVIRFRVSTQFSIVKIFHTLEQFSGNFGDCLKYLSTMGISLQQTSHSDQQEYIYIYSASYPKASINCNYSQLMFCLLQCKLRSFNCHWKNFIKNQYRWSSKLYTNPFSTKNAIHFHIFQWVLIISVYIL